MVPGPVSRAPDGLLWAAARGALAGPDIYGWKGPIWYWWGDSAPQHLPLEWLSDPVQAHGHPR